MPGIGPRTASELIISIDIADFAGRDRGMLHGKALKAVARKRLEVIYAIMGDKVPYAA